jgi:amino acid transporter
MLKRITALDRLPILPFCFLRRLDSLKYTSVAALVSIGYLIILVLAHYLKGDTITDRGPVRVLGWAGFLPALSSLPVVVFAYTCHQNVSVIIHEASFFPWVRCFFCLFVKFFYFLVERNGTNKACRCFPFLTN